MTRLKADNSPIIVDNEQGHTSGSTTIAYAKETYETLWERSNGGTWTEINVHVRTGQGDTADYKGKYLIQLKPGEKYEVGVFDDSDRTGAHGPLSTDPIRVTALVVYCIWKKPEVRRLITDQNRATGGTWHFHQIATNVATDIVMIGLSRAPHSLDASGIPQPFKADGVPTHPLSTSTNHLVEITPLTPGQRYFFLVMVTDAFGNWEVLQEEATTLRRKLTVQFKTLHVYNDGDPNSYGEGEFWFQVNRGNALSAELIEAFHAPTQDIDDWNETDRPYPLGYTHNGVLEAVEPGKEAVSVSSWGIEHDGWFDPDEGAANFGIYLPLPAGRFVETVVNQTFRLDCPTSTVGDDFAYGVDIVWSVEYAS